MKTKKLLGALVATLGLAANAQAGLINVKSIEISNAYPTWLQVAEVVALDMGGSDTALSSAGATAFAPDTWSALSTPERAIDGDTNGAFPNIFHEGSDGSWDTLTIVLAAVQELSSIQVFGRTDCCEGRDVFNISFFDESGSELYSTVSDSRYETHPVIGLPDTSTAVPEPGSLALLGLGLAGLGFSRRKQKA